MLKKNIIEFYSYNYKTVYNNLPIEYYIKNLTNIIYKINNDFTLNDDEKNLLIIYLRSKYFAKNNFSELIECGNDHKWYIFSNGWKMMVTPIEILNFPIDSNSTHETIELLVRVSF